MSSLIRSSGILSPSSSPARKISRYRHDWIQDFVRPTTRGPCTLRPWTAIPSDGSNSTTRTINTASVIDPFLSFCKHLRLACLRPRSSKRKQNQTKQSQRNSKISEEGCFESWQNLGILLPMKESNCRRIAEAKNDHFGYPGPLCFGVLLACQVRSE